jgi:hypothetical protein
MKTANKDSLITLIQIYATGKVTSNFSPQILAEAISQKVDFEKPIDIFSANKNRDVIRKLNKGVRALKTDMEAELKKLDKEEKLFANFLKGKITAYQELLDLLK